MVYQMPTWNQFNAEESYCIPVNAEWEINKQTNKQNKKYVRSKSIKIKERV